MHVIRRAKIEDVDTLLKLARMVHFINLPPDRDIIMEKILRSRECFKHVARGEPLEDDPKTLRRNRGSSGAGTGLQQSLSESELFVFVLEDTETGSLVGSSQLVSSMGGPGNPNVGFKISERRFFSESLHTGMTHTVATLHLDESSPTEIGGLIVQPAYRAHKAKLGRLLSFVRFHFMGVYRDNFADHVLAEMMAPISDAGENLFWDALGRRFINLSYDEADRFCQYSREFMFSLLPREDIYLSLLPPKARQGVGQVGKDTIPARKMLEKLGFAYQGVIDPFDGGPHLQARTDDIPLVRATETIKLGKAASPSSCKGLAIVSTLDSEGEYVAIQSAFARKNGALCLPKDAMAALHADEGDEVACTVISPMPTLDGTAESVESAKKRSTHKKKTTKTPRRKKTG
ncbi:MAG: arginine N-succinyltransferase [Phycisphaerales bacterium]|jgi:arginine N-succinyltransferase